MIVPGRPKLTLPRVIITGLRARVVQVRGPQNLSPRAKETVWQKNHALVCFDHGGNTTCRVEIFFSPVSKLAKHWIRLSLP